MGGSGPSSPLSKESSRSGLHCCSSLANPAAPRYLPSRPAGGLISHLLQEHSRFSARVGGCPSERREASSLGSRLSLAPQRENVSTGTSSRPSTVNRSHSCSPTLCHVSELIVPSSGNQGQVSCTQARNFSSRCILTLLPWVRSTALSIWVKSWRSFDSDCPMFYSRLCCCSLTSPVAVRTSP